MTGGTHGIVQVLLELPVFRAEWVLWLLLGLSVVSVAVILERYVFFMRRIVDVDSLRTELSRLFDRGDYQAAAELLRPHDSIETNVVLFGLRDHAKGPESVEDLVSGATLRERARYERRLNILATVASNAPFIGLFGTVLGIIRAFKDLSVNMAEAGSTVMGGIAEALIATAVGLLVAIPAVVAFNYFRGRLKTVSDNAQFLSRILLAHLKALDTGVGVGVGTSGIGTGAGANESGAFAKSAQGGV